MTTNALLQSDLPLATWLERLPRISATLYSTDAAWETFEPARKQIQDAILWLQAEGVVDGSVDTPQTAIAKAPRYFEKHAWAAVAHKAEQALGADALRELLTRS